MNVLIFTYDFKIRMNIIGEMKVYLRIGIEVEVLNYPICYNKQ
jgi:hypothetical protein